MTNTTETDTYHIPITHTHTLTHHVSCCVGKHAITRARK